MNNEIIKTEDLEEEIPSFMHLKGALARGLAMLKYYEEEDPRVTSKRNIKYFIDYINEARQSPEELAKALNIPLTTITKYINKGLIAIETRQEMDGKAVSQVCKILDACVLPFTQKW